MSAPRSFAFALCQAGAERWLEAEVARAFPSLRPAFKRPGLVTFKSETTLPDEFAFDGLVFARASGVSLGTAKTPEDAVALGEGVGATRLHVAVRERHRPGEAPEGIDDAARASTLARALRRAAPGTFQQGTTASIGDLVLDVVLGEEGEPLFVGAHRHVAGRSPHPGGKLPVIVPEAAPSRAYAKLVEALDFAGFEVRDGQVAVEIGSAPGGASYALLERGADVVGIDPGAMGAAVFGFPPRDGAHRFRHLAVPVGAVTRDELPPSVDWLVMDVHLAPPVALRAAQRLVAWFRPTLRGVIFTLKLHDAGWPERLPTWCDRVAAMGLDDVRARQLPSNRQEVCVVARGRGAARKGLGQRPRRT